MNILSWLESPTEDQPPEDLWMDDKAISDWFEGVRRRYQAKASGMEAVPEAEMQENELLAQYMR